MILNLIRQFLSSLHIFWINISYFLLCVITTKYVVYNQMILLLFFTSWWVELCLQQLYSIRLSLNSTDKTLEWYFNTILTLFLQLFKSFIENVRLIAIKVRYHSVLTASGASIHFDCWITWRLGDKNCFDDHIEW